MLFDYVAADLQPGRTGTVWSQFPLQPLAPGALTPFSYSVLAEIASRAWYLYYDRLGFDPTPRSQVVRRHQGRVYFNLSLPAQLDADQAGVEPLSLRLNGQRQPLANWEKPGFLAGLKLGRAQKKIDAQVAESSRQMEAITEKARAWYLKTQAIRRWSQAEVLQIMEEIERYGVESMVAFFTARYNLGQQTGRLVVALADKALDTEAVLRINNALGTVSGLVEAAMLAALPPLADTMRDPATLAWLQAGDYAEWRTTLPNPAAVEGIKSFLDAYGHRGVHEGEIAHPRWAEDATLLMRALLAHIESPPQAAATATAPDGLSVLLEMLPASARKQSEQSLQKIAELHKLQSQALHALAYIWAGTRSWALAAAREAMVDQRLHSPEEAFFFELEEIKEMMTGEWNISSREEIRATLAERQRQHAAMQQAEAPAILVGDAEAAVTHHGLPGVAGKATGPLCRWDAKQDCQGAVVATDLLDSGFVLTLPFATAYLAASGTPCDPFVVAAQAWQRPIAVDLGKRYDEFAKADDVTTTLDVNANGVAVSQG